jgi:NADH dehydrogenase [ubiquinone] 1 alpha subcomplex assembly factor 5
MSRLLSSQQIFQRKTLYGFSFLRAGIFARHQSFRHLSQDAPSSSTHNAFDRLQKRKQRDNAARAVKAWRESNLNDLIEYDYIREEIATRLVDRLDDMKRAFPLALDWGAGSGHIYRAICADDALVGYDTEPVGGIGGVRKLVQLDAAHTLLHRDAEVPFEGSHRCDTYRLPVKDEEDTLPFPDGTFDLVISSCTMHWVNQLPQVFAEIHRILKPDGCFLLAMMGGTETLPELRAAMVLAELEREGGVSPHVGPFIQVTDVGSLLQRAGFALPTIDVDTHTVSYPNAAVLMEHLQRMGESNASLQRRERVSLDTFLATACIYDTLFPAGAAGEIEASMQVIYAIGWTPHESQPKPLERGTATHKVGDITAVEVTKHDGREFKTDTTIPPT